MQVDAGILITSVKPVFQVTFNWAAYCGKLAPNLVMSTGFQVYFQRIIMV